MSDNVRTDNAQLTKINTIRTTKRSNGIKEMMYYINYQVPIRGTTERTCKKVQEMMYYLFLLWLLSALIVIWAVLTAHYWRTMIDG